MNDNEMLRQLFAAMPEEKLSADFNARLMEKVRLKALKRSKLFKICEYACYTLGIVAMIVVCIAVLKYLEIQIPFPDLSFSALTFPEFSLSRINSDIFMSPSWKISIVTAIIAFVLLILETAIRRQIEK